MGSLRLLHLRNQSSINQHGGGREEGEPGCRGFGRVSGSSEAGLELPLYMVSQLDGLSWSRLSWPGMILPRHGLLR